MSLKRNTYRLDLDNGDGGATTHQVEILHGDQLRAELEAPKHSIPVSFQAAPAHHVTLWLWAALVRTGVVTEGFQDFKPRLLRSEQIADLPDPVGPTQQDQPTDVP